MMRDKDKYVVTDEDYPVKAFKTESAANEYAAQLAIENAIKEIQENQATLEEPSQKQIDEFIAFRGTIGVRPITEEDKKELSDNNE